MTNVFSSTGMRRIATASHAADLEKIDEIAKLRARHGYETVEG